MKDFTIFVRDSFTGNTHKMTVTGKMAGAAALLAADQIRPWLSPKSSRAMVYDSRGRYLFDIQK